MSFTKLKDGGLSVKINGVESADVANELEWESTNQGDGGGSFWLEVSDPFDVGADYPELVHGAPVVVEHTLEGATTRLYTGYVLNDTRTGYSGTKAVVNVQLGGALEVAKGRSDAAFIFTEADLSQWLTNKRSPKAFGFDNSGRIAVTTGDDVKVPHDRAGMIGAVCYLGAQHMLEVMNGWRRITGTASWDLRDHLDAGLLWWPTYKVGLDASDYNTVHGWTANTKGKNKAFDYVFGGASGAGYVALAMWSNKSGGTKTTDERFIELEDVVLYTDVVQKTVDQGMLAIAELLGLHDGADVETIGNVLRSLSVGPYTDPASAMGSLAAQADRLVEWGYFGGRFRARPMKTDPNEIRALGNCYLVDAESPDIDWQVSQHPEEGSAKALRLIYGHSAKSVWPAGTPAETVAPADPGWEGGTPFMGASAQVLTVDFSSRNFTAAHAKAVARSLAQHLGVAEAGGSVSITSPTVPVYGGGTRPTPYIHGGDWLESTQGGTGPMYITRAHVDAETGYVDLDCGLSEDLLIEQLQSAGNTSAVALHKPYKKRRK